MSLIALEHNPAHLYRPARVLQVTRLTPRVRRISLGGDAARQILAAAHASSPAAWIKVRPVGVAGRAYTITNARADGDAFDIDVVIHGSSEVDNSVAAWAREAKPGETVEIAGPRVGGFVLMDEATQLWLIGDETAFPAFRSIISSLSPTFPVNVIGVASHREELQVIESFASPRVLIHHASSGAAVDPELDISMRAAAEKLPSRCQVWVAGEADVTKRWRTYWLASLGLPKESITAKGYWKLGAADHRDG